MQFSDIHQRRPINVGVIAGELWSAHDRSEQRPMTSAPHTTSTDSQTGEQR